jgi:hypothetical protein
MKKFLSVVSFAENCSERGYSAIHYQSRPFVQEVDPEYATRFSAWLVQLPNDFEPDSIESAGRISMREAVDNRAWMTYFELGLD